MLFNRYLSNDVTALCLLTRITHFLPLKTVAHWQQLHCTRQQNLLSNRLFGMCVFNQEKDVDIVIKNSQKGALKVSLIQLSSLVFECGIMKFSFSSTLCWIKQIWKYETHTMSQVSWEFEKNIILLVLLSVVRARGFSE